MTTSSPALKVAIQLPLHRFSVDCSFDVEREVVVLFGGSGAGKTSILDSIAGFRNPPRGEVSLAERTLFSSDHHINVPVHQRNIGYLSQKPALFPHLTVRQNVAYGLSDLPVALRDERVDSALQRFHVAHLAASRPAAISGGEQQRVALARALVREPELLLLDEPLSALDFSLKSKLLDSIFEWQLERSIPMLYVTHDQSEAYSLSRRVMLIERGKIVADGEPHQVFNVPASREQASLAGYENIFDATIKEVNAAHGTMTCRLGQSEVLLESPLAHKNPAEEVCLGLRAGDIIIATERPVAISARNILKGSIERIEDRAGMVEIEVACGAIPFCVHISRGALQSLGLQERPPVWLIIKTHSIQLLRN